MIERDLKNGLELVRAGRHAGGRPASGEAVIRARPGALEALAALLPLKAARVRGLALYSSKPVQPGERGAIQTLAPERWDVIAIQAPPGFAIREVHVGNRMVYSSELPDHEARFVALVRVEPGTSLLVEAERIVSPGVEAAPLDIYLELEGE